MPITAKILIDIKQECQVFIETGSALGNGIEAARLAGFEKIYSIEFYKPRYEQCVERFFEFPNIKLFNCTSSVGLEEILKELTEPAVFWLDAHHDMSGMEAEPRVPEKDSFPIMNELDLISSHYIKTHTILIDDRRFFVDADIIDKLMKINSGYKIKFIDSTHFSEDIIVAYA